MARLFGDRLGISSRVPSVEVWRRREGKEEVLTRPMLATYVFFRANLKVLDWRRFYSINGVIDLVRQGNTPASVPEGQLASLEKLGAAKRPIHEIEYGKLPPDSRVEVIRGPLKGAIGSFLRSDRKTGRFVVSLDLFQRSLVTDLEAEFVRPC